MSMWSRLVSRGGTGAQKIWVLYLGGCEHGYLGGVSWAGGEEVVCRKFSSG